MEYAVTESEINLLSPEAEAVSRVLMSRYGQILICVHMAVYTGIVIAGSILLWTDGTVDPTASTAVWLFQGATGLLMARELAPVVWYAIKSLWKSLQPKPQEPPPRIIQMMPPPPPRPAYVRPEPQLRPGYVYLLQALHDPELYKIGRTKNPHDRMATFKLKLPIAVEYICTIKTDNMYQLESNLHFRFMRQRLDGEWFKLSPEDVEYIKGLAA